ncbi:MAG: aldo/keto reductase [bacterium]|nr:aldo/keto reductase [bacterium]
MEYRRLGRWGVRVSQLALGTLNFGPEASEGESWAIMDAAREAGINFFDTADSYGWEAGYGATEEIIGRWLAQGGGRRESIFLASKVYMRTGDGPNDEGLSAYHIVRACEGSLRRLRTDYIDLYQMHHVDRRVRWEEVWEAFDTLRRQGKIVYAGSSNFGGWQLAQAEEEARARGGMGLVAEQSLYNLCYREVELEVMPACRTYGLGFVAWGVLNRGFLAGTGLGAMRSERGRARLIREYERFGERLVRYNELCREVGYAPAVLATAWVLQRPGVSAVIVGPRTVGQLEESLGATEVELGGEVVDRLEALWPGPGGPAPEAYAW